MGGYDPLGNIRHPVIGKQDTSCVFNFDSSATEPLQRGRAYRWKVWANKPSATGAMQLISASEDLLGLFEIRDESWRK